MWFLVVISVKHSCVSFFLSKPNGFYEIYIQHGLFFDSQHHQQLKHGGVHMKSTWNIAIKLIIMGNPLAVGKNGFAWWIYFWAKCRVKTVITSFWHQMIVCLIITLLITCSNLAVFPLFTENLHILLNLVRPSFWRSGRAFLGEVELPRQVAEQGRGEKNVLDPLGDPLEP